MVKTVFSNQCSVIRSFVEIAKLLKFHKVPLKKVCFFVSFLCTEYWTLSTGHASDLGSHGVIYPIDEQDPIILIQNKLKSMEESGDLERHNRRIQKKTKESVEKPDPVKGIGRATHSRAFTYDPTYTVSQDIKDHLGRVIHAKGAKINPLDTVSLSEELVFIDGDDPGQKLWAFDRIQKTAGSHQDPVINNQKNRKVKLILVKGAPLALSEELGMPVYFDQRGFLTKKLGIKHVPAIVSQSSLSSEETKKSFYLRIEEVCLSCASASKEEANKGGEYDSL